jgi:hypothetical protein
VRKHCKGHKKYEPLRPKRKKEEEEEEKRKKKR